MEYDKKPTEISKILTESIFKNNYPTVRAEALLKLMDQKHINGLLKYILKYSKPNLKDFVKIVEEGISKTSFDSLGSLETDLNKVITRINSLKLENLEEEIARTNQKVIYLEQMRSKLAA